MKIDVRTNISKKFDKVEININAPERNEEIEFIERTLGKYERIMKRIIGIKNNSYYIVNVNDIISFYSREKYNYCKTKVEEYRIKEQLYYLEETLPHDIFIRISNGVIINVDYVKCFDTGTIGTIVVEMKDGTKEKVSKRKNKEIINFIKNIK